ncbi:MAG: SOS response-associated peptidase [Rhizobiales bacterium]|nr:SOS response-associated peptidase [Hyphomicrobiales bacterium]
MCGRIIQASPLLQLAIVDGLDVRSDSRGNHAPRYNGAPGQEHLVIRVNRKTGERSLDPIKWGLIPHWCADPKGGRKPINARSETVGTLPVFRDAYRARRCILPVDGFFEWQVTTSGKQPYAIGMKDRAPFGIAGLWENWKTPAGEWMRTFAVVTVPANALLARLHDRMPAILDPQDYERWLSDEENPRGVLRPFPVERMQMWPISERVNSVRNDDAKLLEPA